jgi:hypothetical protein
MPRHVALHAASEAENARARTLGSAGLGRPISDQADGGQQESKDDQCPCADDKYVIASMREPRREVVASSADRFVSSCDSSRDEPSNHQTPSAEDLTRAGEPNSRVERLVVLKALRPGPRARLCSRCPQPRAP